MGGAELGFVRSLIPGPLCNVRALKRFLPQRPAKAEILNFTSY